MHRQINLCITLLLLTVCGCAGISEPGSPTALETEPAAVEDGRASAGSSILRSWGNWGKTTKPGTARANVVSWDWLPAIPTGSPRAELLSPTLSADDLVHFVPAVDASGVRQVSTAGAVPMFRLMEVNGQPVKDCGQLHTAVEQVLAVGEPAKVSFQNADSSTLPVEIEPATLAALSQAVVPEVAVMRVVKNGKPLTVIRQDGVCCTLTAQLERKTGLVHVVMSLASYEGQRMLPLEIRADFNEQHLRCLTVADTLDVLYGVHGKTKSRPNESACSFAAVSEREDYLLPTNFKQLQQSSKAPENSLRERQQPALAMVPGQTYPGPALLGDARALTEFMLQRQLYQPGEVEQTGWVMFAGDNLAEGGTLSLHVDLGRGPQLISFAVSE